MKELVEGIINLLREVEGRRDLGLGEVVSALLLHLLRLLQLGVLSAGLQNEAGVSSLSPSLFLSLSPSLFRSPSLSSRRKILTTRPRPSLTVINFCRDCCPFGSSVPTICWNNCGSRCSNAERTTMQSTIDNNAIMSSNLPIDRYQFI